jgi:hypothetical protein
MAFDLASRLRTFIAHDVLRFAMLLAAAAFLFDWATKSWALEALEHTALPLGALMLDVERNHAFAFSSGGESVPRELVLLARLLALAGVILMSIRVGPGARCWPSPARVAGRAGRLLPRCFRRLRWLGWRGEAGQRGIARPAGHQERCGSCQQDHNRAEGSAHSQMGAGRRR